MSEAVSAKSNGSPAFDWALSRLGIRPDERGVTAMLFGNMFMSGIAIGMIRVCAFTLFLEHYGADRLALVAILLAVTGTIVTLVIDQATRRASTGGYLYTIIGTIIATLVASRLLLGTDSKVLVIFFLPLLFEIIYMLFSLQFMALLAKLLNVRQSKRLSGITRSGEFLAEMVGGLSIAVLLNFIDVPSLLIVAATATVGVAVIIGYTLKRFERQLARTNSDYDDEEEQGGRLLSMLKMPYVRLITICYAAYIFAYFFVDIAFFRYASEQFPDERVMAEFLGQYIAVVGFVTFIVMVFGFAPFLRRFGMLAAMLSFPVIVAIGCTAVTVLEFADADIALVFGVMVLTNGARYVLQAAIWRPSVTILFQVLPDRQRARGTSLIEGVVDPFAGGVAGACLFVLSEYLQWEPKIFLLLLSGLMVLWVVLGVIIRRMYLSNLVVSIQKRKLGELALQELDTASLNIIKRGLKSPYPAEIFYCLNILEELEHPEITELLKEVIDNKNKDVRMDVLKRIDRMRIEPLKRQVMERINIETDPQVRGQALKTYAALGADNVAETLTPFLEAAHREQRSGALVGLLRHDPGSSAAQDYLLQMIRSEDNADRRFAAVAIGDIASANFSGFLFELLDDNDSDVVNEAILAASNIDDERLIEKLVSKLADPRLQGRATLAIQRFDERALYALENGLTSPTANRQVRRQILEIVREIGGTSAIELLLRHITIAQPELQHQVYLGLATLHYQADPDDQYVFVNKLEEEVQQITWLLAAMEDLFVDERYHQLTAALGQELDQHRDNMLLLVSFLFPSIVMLDTRANIDSKVSELRVFALEVLDNLLTPEIKQVVIPILDDISVSERLVYLRVRYPQESMTPDNRFHTLVEQHFNERFFWTRASLLHLIGKAAWERHQDVTEAAMKDPEPIVRETASWALAQLDPPDLRRSLTAHLDDADGGVRSVVSELLEALND